MPPNGNLKFLVDTQPLWWPRDFGFEQRQFFDVTALWAFVDVSNVLGPVINGEYLILGVSAFPHSNGENRESSY